MVLVLNSSYAQIHCGLVEIEPGSSENSLMTFDTFSKYEGGITYNGVAKIKITVEDQVVVDPLCSWSLSMIIDNNPGAGTPVDEWEELAQYGNGLGDNPLLNMLEIRVRNNCSTSPMDGIYQAFTNNMDILDIIAPLLPVTPAGTCNQDVNGPGSYITNYDEFVFTIDIRVKPDFTFNPGIYGLSIKFHLEENP